MTRVSPAVDVASLHRIPDLEISIRRSGSSLVFEVHAADPDEAVNRIDRRSGPLPMGWERLLSTLIRDIEYLATDTEEARREAESKLAIKGLEIWEIFPGELQEILWKRRRRALSLWIQSEEPSIPWEIAKLQSRHQGRIIPGPYLCEAFAVTRWLHGMPPKIRLPLERIAMVVPHDSKLVHARDELSTLQALAEVNGRKVEEIEPKAEPVRAALASGIWDTWHFAGHGVVARDHPDLAAIELDDHTELAAEDLRAEAANLGLAEPLVFFNGCSTGRSGFVLAGLGGWPRRFLQANAGAFIGTHWSIKSSKATEFAASVYKGLFRGLPIGQAVRRARRALHKKYPGDSTWLAYTVFAHPLASCAELKPVQRPAKRAPPFLTVPVFPWRRDVDSPGALLRAQYGVVPFHGRDEELGDLDNWCRDATPVGIRLYTGPGGMGKTRLALEVALKMKDEGWWSGFVTEEAKRFPERAWDALSRPEGKLLLIVDYAETNRPFLIPVLRQMYCHDGGPIRLILLARSALDWWEQLKGERDGVGQLLSGPATTRYSLRPLADSIDARASSYSIAARAFSERLKAPPAAAPDDLGADYFRRVLILHMRALIDIEGEGEARGEDHILDRILHRERKFWETRTVDHGVSRESATGIGRAMAAITLGGGVGGEAEAVEVLRGLQFFQGQSVPALTAVARLLHECYPGERWIEPLQPDLLGEHLAQRELEKGADELLDLVLGPRIG